MGDGIYLGLVVLLGICFGLWLEFRTLRPGRQINKRPYSLIDYQRKKWNEDRRLSDD